MAAMENGTPSSEMRQRRAELSKVIPNPGEQLQCLDTSNLRNCTSDSLAVSPKLNTEDGYLLGPSQQPAIDA
jgi:hypothetical protein